MNNQFTEYKKNSILLDIDLLVQSIEQKILPAFEIDKLEIEALQLHSRNDYEDTVYYYISMSEAKNDMLNFSSVWLYHMFEKHCNEIFSSEDWKIRKNKLKQLDISIGPDSNFYYINDVLQDICNVHKHGKDSRAQERLKKIREDLFDKKVSKNLFSDQNTIEYRIKNFEMDDLNFYSSKMKDFWAEIYTKDQARKRLRFKR